SVCFMRNVVCVRVGRIELPSHPWQGCILPLNHTRKIVLGSTIRILTQNRKFTTRRYYLIHTCVIAFVTSTRYYCVVSTRGEMDITTDFGSVVLGSSPGGCTAKL